jgi:prepilin-type N-terminal cleavage/methylation domain-containing protein
MKFLKTKNYRLSTSPAFTFLELLLVIGIIGILATASTPFFSRFFMQSSVSSSTEHIVSTLRKAQEYTIAGKNDSAWQAKLTRSVLTLVQQSGNTVFDTYTLNPNVTVAGLTTVSFTRPLGRIAAPVTVSVSGGNNTKSISVNTEGVVSY